MPESFQIPSIIADRVSPQGKKIIETAYDFVINECIAADTIADLQLPSDSSKRFLTTYPSILDDLKSKARKLGLWNLFLSNRHYKEGVSLSTLEYALVAEILGQSIVAPEAMNCAAPDTGNMELLAKYGTEDQKSTWLKPLLEGKIRSAFAMTERAVSSSDARNICLEIKRYDDGAKGAYYILNGTKWWISGAGDPRCKVYLVMGKSDPNHPNPYKQQSVIIVPADTPGITVKRALTVFGYDDAPHGHCELVFKDVKVPASNIVFEEGRGFEIIQNRLGPGRIHHCMRCIGVAERALEYMISRVNDPNRITFGKPLSSHGVILEWIARSRIEIDAARFLVLSAADMMDRRDAKGAMKQIAMAKVMVPSMVLTVLDRAIQAHGAGGICDDFPLARMWAITRTLRFADGPDEVHLNQLGRTENRRAKEINEKLSSLKARQEQLMKEWKVEVKANL